MYALLESPQISGYDGVETWHTSTFHLQRSHFHPDNHQLQPPAGQGHGHNQQMC